MLILKIILQILIGVATFLVVYLDYKWHDKRTNLYKKARKILIFTTIAILIGSLVVTIVDDKNQKREKEFELQAQEEKFQEQIFALKNVDKKVTNVDECMADANEGLRKTYEVTIAMTDSLGKINKSTINLVQKYENSIKRYDILNKQLDEVIKQTNLKLEESKANLLIAGNIQWQEKSDSIYQLLINFSNFGKRDCINTSYKVFLIQTDSLFNCEGVDLEYFKLDVPIPGGTSRMQTKYSFKLSQFDNSFAIIYLKYKYEDEINKEPIIISQGYIWHGQKRDGFNFLNNSAAKEIAETILKQKGSDTTLK